MSAALVKQFSEIQAIYQGYLDKSKHLTEEQLNKKPSAEGWSMAQLLQHLWIAMDATASFIDKRLKDKKATNNAGFKHSAKSLLLGIALILPIKFKAPRSITEVSEHITYEELCKSYSATFDNFRKIVQEFPEELRQKEIFKHPRVGYLTIEQTLRFVKQHALHHKSQFENLVK